MTCTKFSFCVNDIEIDLVNQVNNLGYGFQPHRFGSQYWQLTLGAPPMTDEQIREIEKVKNLNESGAGGPLCVYDVRRPKLKSIMDLEDNIVPPQTVADRPEYVTFFGDPGAPKGEYVDFFGDAGVASPDAVYTQFFEDIPEVTGAVIGTSQELGTIEIDGLAAGITFTCGDYIGYQDAEGRCWAHRVTDETVVTDGGVTTLTVRPRPETNTGVTFDAEFEKVGIPLILIFTPFSASVASGRLNTFTVSGYEYVPVF